MATISTVPMPKLICPVAVFLTLLWLSGCASVSVDKVTLADKVSKVPQKIYVKEFDAPPEVLRVDRSGKSLEKFRNSLKARLAKAITVRANKRLLPAQTVSDSDKIPREAAWVVTGRFLTVNQGSRLLRAVVGLGMGGTKLETVVTVYDLSKSPPRQVLKFVTTGGSNSLPGAVFGLIVPNYWLIALDSAGKSAPGLSMDVIRTSREIVAVLSEYMAKEGFLSPAKISRSKKLGQWP